MVHRMGVCFRKVLMGYLKTVGSEAYVQLPTFVAINEGCVCTCESLMEGVWYVGHCRKQDTSSFSLRADIATLVSASHHAGV